ncbi:hypothetical protein CPC08DRAFT_651102, partial [Agrocybe pediades]
MIFKAKQIQACGGQEMWNALSEQEREIKKWKIIRNIWQQVFDTLPECKQTNLSRFIRVGCCMHKGLNCVKGGAKVMADAWHTMRKTPPQLLVNKNN